MFYPIRHRPSFAVSVAAALLWVSAASADDTEIFISQPADTVQANILLIIDTSGSMNETAGTTQLPYDASQTYSDGPADCESDRIYYSNSSTAPNSCNSLSWFPASVLKCQAAATQLAFGSPANSGSGYFTDRFVRWRGSGSSRTWASNLNNASSGTASDVECIADQSIHGPDASSSAKWPQAGNADQSNGRWTSTVSSSWWGVASNTGASTTFYSPNYIRYVRNPPLSVQTRMDVVKAAAASFLNSLPNVNLGVMRYSTNAATYSGSTGGVDTAAAGGMMMSPVSPLDAKRAALISDITTSTQYEPHGWTPLSETLFEAYRYFSGGPVTFGLGSRICTRVDSTPGLTGTCFGSSYMTDWPSVAGSRSGDTYVSPAAEPCQANYIVFLTDGLPTQDSQANGSITTLPNFASLGGACDTTDSNPGGGGSNAGRCLGALAEYMKNADLRSTVTGTQNVKTFFIGFGDEFAGGLTGAFDYLDAAAYRGGTENAYQANDLTGLSGVFNAIITSIFQTSTTFTTPTVAVNAFNRTQTLDDLFVSVFQPNSSLHWPGNLKKYRIEGAVIMDDDTPPKAAVDPSTGFFADSAQSFWSGSTDGSEVTEGGAAGELTDPANRKLYTYMGVNPTGPVTLSGSNAYAVSTANTALDTTVLGLGAPGDPTRDDLIDWARGVDLQNEDGDSSTTARRAMGDPIHSPPAVVIYGGSASSPDLDDAVVYVTTNDGYLHAVDTVSGNELWGFIPQEFLGNLKNLYFNDPVPAKQYTLDGEIRVLRYDVNNNGIIESGDRVILYFGQGRGGSYYYALDVTSKTAPKFMWAIGPTQLPGIGQAWSTPVIGRVQVGSGSAQNSQRLVLFMGGGYDTAEDGAIYIAESSVGNRVFMVDALRGTLLWSAGVDGSSADFKHDRMTHSIPSTVAALDTDSDGYTDRLYVGDMGAQLWRFDITTGNAAGSLAAGGVIASLGTHDDATPVPAKARRFYSAPDVAALTRPGMMPYMNIAIGSGYRGHPLNTLVEDRFYAVRDHNPFTRLTQTQYDDDLTIITDDALQDVTTDLSPTIPAGSPGWKLLLRLPSWRGEKSLSPSNTFNNMIFFTTYTPPVGTSTESCGADSTGSNRAYVVNAFDASPIPRQGAGLPDPDDPDGEVIPPTTDDRYEELEQGGIAPEVAFLFPDTDAIVCLSGVEVLGACSEFDSRIKTFWHESGAN